MRDARLERVPLAAPRRSSAHAPCCPACAADITAGTALYKATCEARKQLVHIDRFDDRTMWHDQEEFYAATKLVIRLRRAGSPPEVHLAFTRRGLYLVGGAGFHKDGSRSVFPSLPYQVLETAASGAWRRHRLDDWD